MKMMTHYTRQSLTYNLDKEFTYCKNIILYLYYIILYYIILYYIILYYIILLYIILYYIT